MTNMYVATIAMMVIRMVVFIGIVLLITFVMISRKNKKIDMVEALKGTE